MSDGPDIVFVGDKTDRADLDVVFALLKREGVSAELRHPETLSFEMSSAGLVVRAFGELFSAKLVVGWVFEEWLAPGIALLEMLECAGFRVLNRGATLMRGQNKALMSAHLVQRGVPHAVVLASFNIAGTMSIVDRPGTDTYVCKPGLVNCGGITVRASGGSVCLVEGKEQVVAHHTVLQNLGQPIYLQSYVDRPRNSDIRVWRFGDDSWEAVRKVPRAGEWITNTERGVTLEKYRPDGECLELCRRAADAIGAQIAGIDIGETSDGYVVFEVNTCPTFLPALALLGDTVPTRWASFLMKVLQDNDWPLT